MDIATKDTDARRPGHLRALNRSSDTDFTDSRLKPEPLRLGRRDVSGAESTHMSLDDSLMSPDPGALAGDEDSDLGKCERNWEAESLGSPVSNGIHSPSHMGEQAPPFSDYNPSESPPEAIVHREQGDSAQMGTILSRSNALTGTLPARTDMLKTVLETSQPNMPGESESWLLRSTED
ncbi:hypothetical protein PoMZ_05352 [Pyricularia oryzae]|uniref:Uncharacterized protein n=1 Tax=Pyricularia oryzae TaxID=318829 RepID=A0A4P7NPK9_PYROR|nr:hypothetical protein PoMZ_05352 [Pyricularia oryzae]